MKKRSFRSTFVSVILVITVAISIVNLAVYGINIKKIRQVEVLKMKTAGERIDDMITISLNNIKGLKQICCTDNYARNILLKNNEKNDIGTKFENQNYMDNALKHIASMDTLILRATIVNKYGNIYCTDTSIPEEYVKTIRNMTKEWMLFEGKEDEYYYGGLQGDNANILTFLYPLHTYGNTPIALLAVWSMISSSLKDVQELYAIPPYWIPKHVAWENYVYMFEQAPWFVYFGNTIFITVFTILGQLITCSMAAYAFARLNFKGKNILFIIYLGTMMIPFQAVMIPQFKIIKYMGLIDTKSSLVAVGIFNAFGTFLLRQFFLTIPKELEEAAKIDGCSYPRIFWEVILKNSKPALMTLIIFTFMNTWNDFLRPLIFINSEEKWTLAMGLAQFQGTYVSQWNQMMAGALISMLPILLVYIFAQKYFVQGIVMSGIKG